ncbi:Rid family hydrolase [Variovorax sp. KK3]|uniref:Rid family hydrolase n=1 Tax=Variovorax sp. KK3 TaxID=1855728 RepID=UPI00211759CE|nr:Rid family hydrolase [Variovorax sp. KK3]
MNESSSATPTSPDKNFQRDDKPRRSFLAAAGLGVATGLVAAGAATAAPKTGKPVARKAEGLGMPWEDQYGYAQAVQVGDTIYVSGQLGHDDQGNMVGPAKLDASGRIADHANMEVQMRQTYASAKKILARFGASLADVVEEVVYVTDMDTAFAAGPVRKEAYASAKPKVASTILVTPRLALPTQLIEIKFIARV